VNICRRAVYSTYPIAKDRFSAAGAAVSVPVRQGEEASWQQSRP
jgi:hypothetical protein